MIAHPVSTRRRPAIWPILAMLTSACGHEETVTMALPDPPAPIVRPAEYGFGDDVAGAEERFVGGIDRTLRARYGKPAESHLAAPAGTDFAALRRWYDGQASSWQAMPEVESAAKSGQGGGFGYAQGDRAFVLLWLNRTAADGSQPVTILRYGKAD